MTLRDLRYWFEIIRYAAASEAAYEVAAEVVYTIDRPPQHSGFLFQVMKRAARSLEEAKADYEERELRMIVSLLLAFFQSEIEVVRGMTEARVQA